jgi:uncharacterized CHY-type Zn-finger protein
MKDYWHEAVAVAMEEAGVSATPEQIAMIAEAMEGCHENYGMYMGHNAISHPAVEAADRLRRELDEERKKVTCPLCRGRGRLITYGGTLQCDQECSRCRGEGRITP